MIKRRCTAFLISDFFHWGEPYSQTLTLSARKHDLVAIRTYDEGAVELPQLGLVRFLDAESGEERYIDTSSSRLRKAYRESIAKQLETFHTACLRSGVDQIEVCTGKDYVPELIKLFGARR